MVISPVTESAPPTETYPDVSILVSADIPETDKLFKLAVSDTVKLSLMVTLLPEAISNDPLMVTLSLNVDVFPFATVSAPFMVVFPPIVTLSLKVVSFPEATPKVPFIVN